MSDPSSKTRLAMLTALQEQLACHRRDDEAPTSAPAASRLARIRSVMQRRFSFRRPIVRRLTFGFAAFTAIVALACGMLWARLLSGPIELNLATSRLASAIEGSLGGRHNVEIGGTQLERDEQGRISVRIRDMTVRDADGAIIASAPKAEVGLSGTSLLFGDLHAESISLVGAELSIRIESDGQITISTGSERRPLAITPAIAKPEAQLKGVPPQASPGSPAATAEPYRTFTDGLASFLNWLDTAGTDDNSQRRMLGKIGVKNASLSVDDRRTDKQWSFQNITFTVDRPAKGGAIFTLGSDDEERPWLFNAAVSPKFAGQRRMQVEARRVALKDILLATRLDDGRLQTDIPLSGVLRAELGADGVPSAMEGRLVLDGGRFSGFDDLGTSLELTRADFKLDWDAARGTVLMPFQIFSGGNRITLIAQGQAPTDRGGIWNANLSGGTVVLAGAANEPPLVMNRIMARATIDPRRRVMQVQQAEFGTTEIGVAASGGIDLSGEPRLTLGLAGTQMTASAVKRIWPFFVATPVRNWVLDQVVSGDIEKMLIAINAPFDTLRDGGPPVPDEGMSIDVVARNAVVRPVDGLPPISDGDVTVRVTGRTASVVVSRGTVELPSGRKLSVSNGLFEVPDFHPKQAPTRVRFRVDGPVPAAAELLAMERIRDSAVTLVDPATSRGTFSGQVNMAMPLTGALSRDTTTYNINADVSNFAADKVVMGQKIEASAMKVSASNQGYQLKGDVKIGGVPASLEYRRLDNGDPEVRVQATLDDAARARFGMDPGAALNGPIGVRVSGRVLTEKDSRMAVEVDLTAAKVDNLLPGWVKPAGRPGKATFFLVSKPQSTRLEELQVDAGATSKGTVELDSSGDLISANFPVFAMSDGDRASVRADRAPDGTLKVVMRGDVYDGRGLVRSTMSGSSDPKGKKRALDIDLDVKLGTIAGYHGEALRNFELRASRRNGQFRTFALNGKFGSEQSINGDLRGKSGGRQVVYIETNDAGSLFRFTDTYPRMQGGQMWVAMDPPGADNSTQDGLLNIRDFAIRGEAALDRVASGGGPGGNGVDFSRMRVEFTRSQGRLSIREGVVRGPAVGATIDGSLDYASNQVRMRGTFIPLYGLNNVFGQLPLVGPFLGGSNEGLLGITYEVTGSPSAPVLRVNPMSAMAPGVFRKMFEFRGDRTDQFVEPRADQLR